MRCARSLCVAFAAMAMLAGCAGGQQSAGQPTSEPSTPSTSTTATSTSATSATSPGAESAAPAVVVPEQLRFTAKTLDGADFSGQRLAGKAALLWFWAPWCPTCQREAPSLAGAAQANVGKVEFVGVAAQDDLAAMQDFVAEYQLESFPHLADLDAAIWRRFDVTHQPAYAFISPDGSIEVVKDQLSEAELAERLRQLAAS